MFKAFKTMPTLPRILLGSLILLGLYGLTHRRSQPNDNANRHVVAASEDLNPHGARPRTKP
jgi:hypothetical protein